MYFKKYEVLSYIRRKKLKKYDITLRNKNVYEVIYIIYGNYIHIYIQYE